MAKKVAKKPAKKAPAKKVASKKAAVTAKPVAKAKPVVKAKPAAKAKNTGVSKAMKPVANKKMKAPAQVAAVKTATKSTANMSSLISPLDDRVLVQIEAGERITAGGLIIPDTSEMTGNQRGVVVAVGRGHRGKNGRVQPLDLQIGDRVLLGEMTGDEIEVSGHKLKILRESDVLGVVQK